MSNLLDEFTAVSGIPPVGMPASPKFKLRSKRRRKSLIDSFIGVSDSDGGDGDGDGDSELNEETGGAEAVRPAGTSTARPAPPVSQGAAPEVEPKKPTPPVAPPAATETPRAPVAHEAAGQTLMLSKEIVEHLSRGHSATVRGILLEPTFKVAATAAPRAAVMPESAAAAMATAMASSIVESAPSGAPVDMNAAQPPPAPSTNGKAVSSVFRRFGGQMG